MAPAVSCIHTPACTLYACGSHVALPDTRPGQTYAYPTPATQADSYRLLLCYKGQTVVRFAQKMYIAKKGDVLLFSATEPIEYRPGANHHLYYFDIGGSDLPALLPLSLWQNGVLSLSAFPRSLHATMTALLTERYSEAPCAKESACAHLILLLSALCRMAEGEEETAQAPATDLGRILPAIACIEQEYEKDYTVVEYAKMCDLSEYHFIRLFRSCKGTPPLAYRTAVRMRKAQQLLATTRQQVKTIAAQVGYPDPLHFAKQFKNRCGMTPLSYRKQAQKK